MRLADNKQGDLRSVMQDPQETPAEQQAASQQEKTNTQAANLEQAAGNGEQQKSDQTFPSYEGRIAELEASALLWHAGRRPITGIGTCVSGQMLIIFVSARSD